MEKAPTPNLTPEAPEAPETEIPAEKLQAIEEAMGHSALIATGYTKEDQKNVLREAVDLKTKETSMNHPIITRAPIIGSVIKAGIAARHRSVANRAIEESGDLTSAFNALDLDASKSHILNADNESTRERAWQTLEGAGYSDKNQIDVAVSRLDQNEKVERMDQVTESAVKQALNDYYTALKSGGDKNELSTKFDIQVKAAFDGKENLNTSIDLQKQKEGLEKLVQDTSIEDQAVKTYIDKRISLYKADMKEGIYTKQKVDSIVSAVVAGGLAGGVVAALSGREGRRGLRAAIGTAASAAGVGAIVGGAAGAARGVNKARVRLSEAEIKAATTFDEPSISVETESGSAESEPEPELRAPERPTVSETADEKAWEDYIDALNAYEAKMKEKDSEPSVEVEVATESEGTADNRASKIGAILAGVNKFKHKLTGEEKYLAEIEKLRDRKDASKLIENFDELISKLNPEDADTRTNLIDAYAEAIARGRFSSEKHIDLIKYKDNRGDFESKLREVERTLYGDDSNAINSLLADENSGLNQLINNKREKLNNDFNEANKLRSKFIIRSALVDATIGAAMGGAAGGIFGAIKDRIGEGGILGILHDKEATSGSGETEELTGDVELVKDPDGGFTVKIGDHELIGEGDTKGIEFDQNGAITPDSKELLENAGIEVHENVTEHTFEHATRAISFKEFFNSANKDANNLTEISDRSWITDNGRDMVMVGNTHMDGDGNIIMQITPTGGHDDLDVSDMKLVLTPGNGNIETGITLDVNPDGTVEIPAGSPAASLFDGENYRGGYAEIARIGDNGHLDVYQTLGDGHPDTSVITVSNPDAVYNEYDYTFTINGEDHAVEVPEDIASAARLEALNGFESVKGTGEPIGYETNGDITNLTTASGEAVEVEHFEHYGGYNDAVDSYFGEKEGVYNSGASVIRQMIGSEGEGVSSEEADRIFLDKINSGEIKEGDVVEEYLKTMGNSPEALTTTRAMMGDFKFDIDGDGTAELIDTQDEINLVSDIVSSDPEAYDNFVNDTYGMFYDKIAGGSIRFVDYTQERYDYTTWGVLGEDNNILQRLGITGDRPTNGVGIVFVDKDGNSIYDEETIRKLWHLPEGYNLEYVSDRLNCIQKTGRGFFEQKTSSEKSTDEKATSEKATGEKTTGEGTVEKETGEKTTPEKTTHEKTTREKTTDEKSTDEKQTGEKTTDEKNTDEKSTDEKTTDEKTTDEGGIEPKDYENMQRIDNNIDNDIKQDIGTNEIRHNPNPGVSSDDLTEKPSASDYQGTKPTIVQNETSTQATPVQESVSSSNDYSSNSGGAHESEYHPVADNSSAQAAADSRGDTAASGSEIDDILSDVGIN